ncbi:methane/phenol/toluene hydroxylase [Pseudomonas sp. BAY1663]|nr:methane/phenol/toluene hydroxylase [Pseudomonas sp. BAY1663]
MSNNKKLGLKDKYRYLTRDLDWEPSYQKKEDIYPTSASRGSRSPTGTSGKTPSA